MSTITKERVAQIIHAAGLEPCDYEEVFESIKTGEIVAMARIALASLEAEAVAMRWRYLPDGIHEIGEWNYRDQGYIDTLNAYHLSRQKELLYTAHPAPVSVPDEVNVLLNHLEDVLPDDAFNLIDVKTWNNVSMLSRPDVYRAAMLQGADGNSPVIPDGLRLALSNAGIAAPESDEMLAATCEKYIQELVTWVKDRKPFQPAAPDFREIVNSSTNNCRENAETSTKCWCRTCRPVTISDMRFVVCPECGNKRCPHANDHRNACTGSNEPGQEGSAYPAAPQQEVK